VTNRSNWAATSPAMSVENDIRETSDWRGAGLTKDFSARCSSSLRKPAAVVGEI